MSFSSNITKERILSCAKQEFLQHGYQNANLRNIASQASVTTGALYRHFDNKEELFYSIVKDVYENTFILLSSADASENIKYHIETNTIEKGFERMRPFKEFIYDNMDEFRLLLLHAKGSKVEDFLSKLTEMYTDNNMEFIEKAIAAGAAKKIPSKMAVHFLTSGFLSAVLEVVLHNVSREEAEEYLNEICIFQHHGWNGLIGIE